PAAKNGQHLRNFRFLVKFASRLADTTVTTVNVCRPALYSGEWARGDKHTAGGDWGGGGKNGTGGGGVGGAARPTPAQSSGGGAERAIQIPINFNPPRRHEIRELLLFVSTDQGATWNQEARAKPDSQFFSFYAANDGVYWFAIAILDVNNQLNPPDLKRITPG